MKSPITFFMLLIIKEISADVVQRPPLFKTPIFSDSYLPATMQVTFHAVEQLRQMQVEGIEYNTNILISSSPSPPGLTTWQIVSRTGENIELTTATPEMLAKHQTTIPQKVPATKNENLETKYETTKAIHVTPATHHKKAETNHQHNFKIENISETSYETFDAVISSETSTLLDLLSSNENTTPFNEVADKTKNKDKNYMIDKQENLEDDDEETRFSLLGEKVTKVPKPSLISYLKLSAVPLRASLQQLASLYDTLSKEVRKQGFAKYAGYSEEVLKTLETSAGGGIGPQLKNVLQKILDRNELAREDSKTQAKEVLLKLEDSGSHLSTDLRLLLPLRYIP